ncbi:hypothetical protein ABH939_006759, partial [Rhodococcus sp. 27YEA6]
RDLLKNHAVAASTSSIGTISATALHHYPGLNFLPSPQGRCIGGWLGRTARDG